MKNRSEITKDLNKLMYAEEKVIAVWEGGSVATGFADEYSDLDIVIVCEDDAVEEIFSLIESHLEKSYGIIKKYRVPEPAWHGFSQCFYKTGNVPGYFYFDVAVIRRSVPDKFTAKDRHGDPAVWFDKEKIIDTSPTPEEKVIEKGKEYFRHIFDSDFLMETELKKAIARKNFTEAFQSYIRVMNGCLGILLNLKYRPSRVDFGLRYAYRDFPEDEVKLLTDSYKINSIDDIEFKASKVLNRINELKSELKPEWY